MRWPQDAAGWPNAAASRLVECRPHRWHVQEMGEGPLVLLLHGAGGATQSWRDVLPILARARRVVAVDLPGQGFTRMGTRQRCGLDHMAEDLLALCAAEDWRPGAIVGHSAGGALALRMAEAMDPAPPIVGINAALAEFDGVAGWLFPMMARLLSAAPFAADIFAATSSSPAAVRRLIDSTGSRIGPEGLALYRRLVADRGHVDATLAMMAQWSLTGLQRRLPEHPSRTLLLAGTEDGAVPPRVSERAGARMPRAEVETRPLGHLMHEEAPEEICALIEAFLGRGEMAPEQVRAAAR